MIAPSTGVCAKLRKLLSKAIPMPMFRYRYLLLLLLAAACRPSPDQSYTPPPRQVDAGLADSAMVVSAHPLASQIGVEVLKAGGHAADAAIAVQFALAVLFPEAGNLGGGGFAVLRQANGQPLALDFREEAPGAATRTMYQDSSGEVIPGLSWWGHLASGVPGSVAGLQTLYDSLGTLPWARLLQPAVELAHRGFAISEKEAHHLNEKLDRIRRHSTRPSAFTEPDRWQAGDTLRQPALSRSLALIRDQGAKGFYRGWIADSLVAEMQRGGGLITHADLQAYRAQWRPPVQGRYREYQIISMPPPSSGGIALLQMLRLADQQGLHTMDWHTAQSIHLMTEVERRVYADRSRHLGDPDFYPVPRDTLLSSAYWQTRMADYDPQQATASEQIDPLDLPRELEQTTHTSIVDAQGNAVSLTTTLNGWYGNCVVVGGAGFFLNNEMNDFSAKPGEPNFFGLIGDEANAIEPGKRMLSSMTPTIVLRDSALWMVVGTPGGSTIITSVFQQIVNVAHFGFNMQASVEAPRFHHQWLPDTIQYEPGAFSEALMDSLRKMGHALAPRGPIGRVDAIRIRPDGQLEGGADPRGDDVAQGY
jgi:gamma-glutamyltranspeptidase / glutathione hydrolase